MINTAEFTYTELRKARESRKMPRWKLAVECGVSESTVERWETGETRPDPDDVGRIEKALNADGLWDAWMHSTYDSYRERHPLIPPKANLTETVVRMKHEIEDIMPFMAGIERDTLNGEFNETELWHKFAKEASEAQAAIQRMLEKIPDYIRAEKT